MDIAACYQKASVFGILPLGANFPKRFDQFEGRRSEIKIPSVISLWVERGVVRKAERPGWNTQALVKTVALLRNLNRLVDEVRAARSGAGNFLADGLGADVRDRVAAGERLGGVRRAENAGDRTARATAQIGGDLSRAHCRG